MAKVRRDVGLIVARMVGESSAMDDAAERVRDRAKALARQHRQSGDYIDSIEITSDTKYKGVKDRLITATDAAAAHIEWGHMARRGEDAIGPPRWVPGQFIMTNAAKE